MEYPGRLREECYRQMLRGPQYGAAMANDRDPHCNTPTVLTVERSGHVAIVFLDRPAKRNALGDAFFAELPQTMAGLSADRTVRAVVIAAKGQAFTVGLDLATMGGLTTRTGSDADAGGPDGESPASGDGAAAVASPAASAARIHGQVLRLQDSISSVADCPKPVIAAIHGYCIGGGVDLISACDLRLASADAIFSVRETRMAMVADLGTLARLPLILPLGQVAELAYTGKDIDADARADRPRQLGPR